jgi:hypothetical protein
MVFGVPHSIAMLYRRNAFFMTYILLWTTFKHLPGFYPLTGFYPFTPVFGHCRVLTPEQAAQPGALQDPETFVCSQKYIHSEA